MLFGLLNDSKAKTAEVWLSGPDSFRKRLYPEYKANRLKVARPRYEQDVKDFLVREFKAQYSDNGYEADDLLGIRSYEIDDTDGQEAIIVHLDKDLNQIPGLHFNWELRRNDKVVREKRLYGVTIAEANRFFWYQLIVGDSTDNIKGVIGMGPKKAEYLLSNIQPQERYQTVLDLYSNEEEMDMNAQCVYIHRNFNDNWRNLIE